MQELPPPLSSISPDTYKLENISPLDLDALKSPQQFYDAIWSTLGDLNGWLETLETSFNHVNIQ